MAVPWFGLSTGCETVDKRNTDESSPRHRDMNLALGCLRSEENDVVSVSGEESKRMPVFHLPLEMNQNRSILIDRDVRPNEASTNVNRKD